MIFSQSLPNMVRELSFVDHYYLYNAPAGRAFLAKIGFMRGVPDLGMVLIANDGGLGMLKLGVNSVGKDFNRKTVHVHHITDDITGRSLPVCGADIYDLIDGGDAEPYLLILKRRQDPFDRDTSSRMCGRCTRAYLSKGSDEEKASRRLARAKRKEARAMKINANKQRIISESLNRCPRCSERLTIMRPEGFSDAEGVCKHCSLKWSFSILAEPSGSFVILADDESEAFNGRAAGHVELARIVWTWR